MKLLKNFFANFLRSRHIARHFRRHMMPHSLARQGLEKIAAPGLSKTLLNLAQIPIDNLFQQLDCDSQGLSRSQAEQRRDQYGLNEIQQERPLPWWKHLWHCYRNPFNLLLTALAGVSFMTDDLKAASVIGSMIGLSTLLRFWQEHRSNREADTLKAMVSNTATVIRRIVDEETLEAPTDQDHRRLFLNKLQRQETPIKLLVPGDLITLSAGDMIPADCRILTAKDLFVTQSAMTGESMPVEKFVVNRDQKVRNPLDLENIVFMGTNVISGSATALVFATGDSTFFGALASKVMPTDRQTSAFHSGINGVSWLLIRFMVLMVPFVFFINGFTKHDWMQALLFALSIAVGLTPEMLPMIVTSTLAKGAVFLSRKKVIVKRLDAIQNFGAMNVLCTDKTGTLTQDKIFLARHVDVWGSESDAVLQMAYLNSYHQTGLKNLLDVAVLEHVEIHQELNPVNNYRKIDELPFDFSRRRMSVIVSERDDHHKLICKGAVDEILSICKYVQHGRCIEHLDQDVLIRLKKITSELNEDGMRVVAVAVKEMPPQKEVYNMSDERELTLIGYVAFLDPPKESTAPALKALKRHGIQVKVLTGDNELVTAKICKEVGLDPKGILLGNDLEGMSDEQLAPELERHDLYARLTPLHKERIVRLLKSRGHVVGFMGDGINDAPALRTADIGISVDTAVDIAKEAADIILLEKSLMVLEQGVLEGRRTFLNMLKYIKMTASSNFGNVLSVLVASASLPFLPMLPMHFLIQNLLYDMSQIAIPFDHVDLEQLEQPQRWQVGDVGRFMIYFGPLSSIFDLATFYLMWQVFGANSPEKQALFQSGWFLVGLMTQNLIVHMIRTAKIPFVQSRAAPPLLITSALILIVGVFLPMGPAAHYFKLQALPGSYFLFLPIILVLYMTLTQLMKKLYIRKFGWQ
jgi:Mg2+-importing ATPase